MNALPVLGEEAVNISPGSTLISPGSTLADWAGMIASVGSLNNLAPNMLRKR